MRRRDAPALLTTDAITSEMDTASTEAKDDFDVTIRLSANTIAVYLILKLRVVASTVPHKRSVPSDTM